ncbi:MAG: DUF4214 domain-containing protein [Acidimicrobiia bacterium]|nr:DUF4214 domain-containing protein [Acidimicrobiia bacterium]
MQFPPPKGLTAPIVCAFRALRAAAVCALVVGLIGVAPVTASAVSTNDGDSVAGYHLDVLGDLATLASNDRLQPRISDGDGISASVEEGLPLGARAVIESVLDEFDSVLALPSGAVQIAVGWRPQASLGMGGPVIVNRSGRYYPAAVADARFGGHHAAGPVDGYVSMGSDQPWYFGSSADVPSDRYDFRTAFAHELVHALGFAVETRIDDEGRTVLSGRTEQLDDNLFSQGRRLVELEPADQSAAFASDDVWVDVGGQRLFPLKADSAGVSHFGNAVSITDTAPGALMYAGLINGVRHTLDAPVIGALGQLGFGIAVPPREPQDAVIQGNTLRWSVDLSTSAPPPSNTTVVLSRQSVVLAETTLPGAVERFTIPTSLKPDSIEIRAVSVSGASASSYLEIVPPTMQAATSLAELVTAEDYRPEYGDVLRLYWAFFSRESDVAGAKYWIGLYRSGVSLDRIAGAFAGSGEFSRRYGSISHERYLQIIYRNVLGRASDGAGFAYWYGLLTSGRLNRGSVVRWIATSPEFIAAHPY